MSTGVLRTGAARAATSACVAVLVVAGACTTPPPTDGGDGSDDVLGELERRFGSLGELVEDASEVPASEPLDESAVAELAGIEVDELAATVDSLAVEPDDGEDEVPIVDWTGTRPDTAAVEEIRALLARSGQVDVIAGFAVAHVGEGDLDPAGVDAQRASYASITDGLAELIADTESSVRDRWVDLPLAALRVDRVAFERLVGDDRIARLHDASAEAELTLDATPDIVETDHRDWAPGNDSAGAGRSIAVIDTGVEGTHPAFTDPTGASRVTYSACFFSMGSGAPDGSCPDGTLAQIAAGPEAGAPCAGNACDHGTHVAGIAAGLDPAGTRTGVAPAASLTTVRLGHAACFGFCLWLVDDVDMVNGFSFVNLVAAIGEPIDALNGSFKVGLGPGETCSSHYLSPALANLASRDVALVFAAGNEGETDSIGFPACAPETIAVSATDDDSPAGFSNISAGTDLWAPGVAVDSTLPASFGLWGEMDGTSMSTPHVAGAVAAIRQVRPDLTAPEIRSRLRRTGYLVRDDRPGGLHVAPRLRVSSAITPWGMLVNDGSGQPAQSGSHDPDGPTAIATLGTGTYLALMPGAGGSGEREMVTVTAAGGDRCSATDIEPFSTSLFLITCTSADGTPVDSDFHLQVVRDPVGSNPASYRRGAQVAVDQPAQQGVSIPTGLNINPTGADNLSVRLDPGEHLVLYPGVAWNGQSVLVSRNEVDSDGYCRHRATGAFFGIPAAVVECRGTTGSLVDTSFSAALVDRSGPHPGLRHHASVDQPMAGSHHPTQQGTTHWGDDQVHVFRLGVGRYRVDFAGWPQQGPTPRRSFAVTASGAGASWCHLSRDLGTSVDVECRSPSNDPVDSRFHIASFADHLGAT